MATDLIVSFLSSVPHRILEMFKDKPATIACPVLQSATPNYPGGRDGYRKWLAEHADGSNNVIPGLAQDAGIAPGEPIGRVAALGFSNGCIGVWEMLRAPDCNKIDAALLIDGIHGVYGWDGKVQPGMYKPILNFAARCAQQNPEQSPDAPVCVITHSSIGPIMAEQAGRLVLQSPSTTETADFIWSLVSGVAPGNYLSTDCGYGCVPSLHLERMASSYADVATKGGFRWQGLQDGWYDRRGMNNFYVFGWGELSGGEASTKDPAGVNDHIFQGQVVLEAVLEEFVVRRWNRECFFVAGVGGLGDAPMSGCKLGQGIGYSESDAGPHDYFPDLTDTSPAPASCPLPPQGSVLVGAPDDPCAIVGPGPVSPPPPEGILSATNLIAGVAGFGAGYLLIRGLRK